MQIQGANVLVTGGTGSFGNRVARHLSKRGVREIRIFSRDEKKQWEMARDFPQFRYIIGDVRDVSRLHEAMEEVDIVFHAAALKQVPSCELYPWEAVKTNVAGSQNVCESAIRAGVKIVVALSTDKAVKPVNAMGTSKAMMEKIVTSQNATHHRTVFCCVRYGNVMGSRGSVIPLFRKQIESGEPLTITVPDMTRFLMTLDHSVELVFHAIEKATGGEVFVRKAPACTVLRLAEVMRRKYSPRGDEHPIEVIGIRAGEKIHEVLVNEYEIRRAEEMDNFYAIYPEYRDAPVTSKLTAESAIEYTSENTKRLTEYEEMSTLLDQMGQVEYFI